MGSPCIPGGASGALRACGTTIPTARDTDGPWVGKDWTEWKLAAPPLPPTPTVAGQEWGCYRWEARSCGLGCRPAPQP